MVIEVFEEPEAGGGDYYSSMTASLGEWYERGFYDPEDESWFWDWYSEEQYERVCGKFLNRFWYRECAVLPAFRWKQAYLEKMNEIMPKYKMLYSWLDEGFDPRMAEDVFGKSRDIFSDFPATLLGGNSDYASNGTDNEYEKITYGRFTEVWDWFVRHYRDPDVLILDECDTLFGSVLTSTVPLY